MAESESSFTSSSSSSSPPPSSSTSSSTSSSEELLVFSKNKQPDPDHENPRKLNNNNKRQRDNSKHPVYRGGPNADMGKMGIRNKRAPEEKSDLARNFLHTEMAARAHDVAALSIKGDSAILNFPELSDSLPRPASNSPRDVQAAAAKAASMDFDGAVNNNNAPSYSSTVTQQSSSSTVEETSSSPCDDVATPEELSEIVELPSLGTSYYEESPELRDDVVFAGDPWIYNNNQPWYEDYFCDQLSFMPESVISSGFELLLWED